MKSGNAYRWVVAAAAILVAGTILAGSGGVWVSRDGTHHSLGSGDIHFSDESSERFDVADLADGETRTFGTGEKQITATREGDVVNLEITDADSATRDLTCRLSTDSCYVLTFDDSDKVALMIEKSRTCANGEGDCDMMISVSEFSGHAEGANVFVHATACDDGEQDCELEWHESTALPGHAVVEIITDTDGLDSEGVHDVRVMALQGGHHDAFVIGSDDVTTHDLAAELLDGETRIFGSGKHEIVAVREGDEIRLSGQGHDDQKPLDITCRVDVDGCKVMTFENDPDKTMIWVEKNDACEDGQDDCRQVTVDVQAIAPDDARLIQVHSGSRIMIIDDDDHEDGEVKKVRKVRVVREH